MTDLDDLSTSFRRHLRAEGKSPRTCDLYLQSVRYFGRWLTERSQPATLAQLTRPALRDWLATLSDTKAPGTVRTRYRGMARFCGWLLAEGELDQHPMTGIELPEVPPKPVPVLSDEQLAAVLKACHGSRRDEAIIRFLIDCGVRVAELCGIRLDNLKLDHDMALVTGKGGGIRPVYFSSRTVRALDRYTRERARHRWAHLDAFFLGQRGPLTPDGVRELVRVRVRLQACLVCIRTNFGTLSPMISCWPGAKSVI